MTDASDPLFRIVQDADECVIALEPVVAQNAGQAARLRSELKSLMDKGGYRQLTVDCDAMDYLPGSVLGILAGFYGKGPEIRLVNASEEIMSLMQTSRLDQKLRVSPRAAR